MEAFSALLAACAGNSPVPGEFPAQRLVTRSFDFFFHLRLNKRLSKQSWCWWFETLYRAHYDVTVMIEAAWRICVHCSEPSRYPNQSCLIVNCTIRDTLNEIWIKIPPFLWKDIPLRNGGYSVSAPVMKVALLRAQGLSCGVVMFKDIHRRARYMELILQVTNNRKMETTMITLALIIPCLSIVPP